VITTQGDALEVENPSRLPPADKIERVEEPYVRGSIFVPTEFMSEIYKLAQEKRGEHKSLEYMGKRVHIRFDFPLSEIVVDFYDKLKSISKGYASFDYDFLEFRESDMVKLDILLNGDPVDALSVIGSSTRSPSRPRSAAGSSPARPSRPWARTSPPSATAATSPASASCSRSRRKARSA